MQYILTEEEYRNLVPKSKYLERNNQLVELEQLVMKLSGHICIYENKGGIFSYCDNCPLAKFDCGRSKEFSK